RLCAELGGAEVARLVERALVRRVNGRFTLLEPIRAYALERLREAGSEDAARARHLRVFVEYAESANARIFAGTDIEAAYDALDTEHDNIRTAIDWASATGRVEDEVALAVALRSFWNVRGHIAEARSRFDRAIAHVPDDAGAVRASALACGASFAYRQADLATARAWWEEALELYRALGETAEAGRCLGELGSVALGEGDVDLAVSLYAESAEVFERENVPMRLAIVLANLAAIETLRGELVSAAEHAGRAAELQRESGDRDGLAVTLHNLARILMALERPEDARASLRASLE